MLFKSFAVFQLAIRTAPALTSSFLLCGALQLPGDCQQYTTLVTPSGHKYKIIATGQETRADGKLFMTDTLACRRPWRVTPFQLAEQLRNSKRHSLSLA